MKNNLLLTVLQALRVPHTAGFAEELFESHPYRHSLLGLSRSKIQKDRKILFNELKKRMVE